ncbi:MarR family winged helix-turn-helix transcriptional regulator [Clostridium hydrogenum]|uniref:MarR family winged helix-turn-helix transcriptional regulator n=1 Tax=Clostridium hydrogenum TaxID=2855764 RepID=UPI001F170A94|nr:MarR family winged helix-turn-helix transcriptional regulator [Clostridium hydrogenum]
MDNSKKYVDSFSKVWHKVLKFSYGNQVSEKFKELKQLSHIEISIISLIYNNPDIIIREICDEIDVPKSSMTSMIDRLEKKNYLIRVISKRDRRSFGLKLTEEGMKIQEQHEKYEEEIFNFIINSLDTEEEKETFIRLTDKIANNMKEFF